MKMSGLRALVGLRRSVHAFPAPGGGHGQLPAAAWGCSPPLSAVCTYVFLPPALLTLLMRTPVILD